MLKGRSGRGKIHLETAIAYQAILHGRDALATYVRPQLLVVDERHRRHLDPVPDLSDRETAS